MDLCLQRFWHIRAAGGDDRAYGGYGRYDLPGNDQLYGEQDDDILRGGAGDDELYGGFGNDNIKGGDGMTVGRREGADTLDGGNGSDICWWWARYFTTLVLTDGHSLLGLSDK